MTKINISEGFNQGKDDILLPILDKRWDALVIGSSTGGPKALTSIISNLPDNKNSIPIFIVQHMPKGFTSSFAQRLDSICALRVKEGQQGELIRRGHIYIAPGDYHMILEGDHIVLDQRDKYLGVRPAVDYLFQTAAPKYKNNLLSIIFTGMGKDGTEGIRHIRNYGGTNIAQDRDSSVVFGMPGSAIESNNVDAVLSLDEISKQLNILIKR
jgi:two-component system chemotaxis response regulator CheB